MAETVMISGFDKTDLKFYMTHEYNNCSHAFRVYHSDDTSKTVCVFLEIERTKETQFEIIRFRNHSKVAGLGRRTFAAALQFLRNSISKISTGRIAVRAVQESVASPRPLKDLVAYYKSLGLVTELGEYTMYGIDHCAALRGTFLDCLESVKDEVPMPVQVKAFNHKCAHCMQAV